MATSAVGIDVGNGKCVVAVSRDGVVDAVLNEASKRETATVVQFCGNHRLFGSPRSVGDTKSAIDQLKRLVIKDDRLLQYEASTDDDGGTVVKVKYLGEQQQFTVMQMLGMLLAHLKRTAEQTLGHPISACVIGIPSYLDVEQRDVYRYAAKIAGLKPLQLLHDGLATATEYGIYRAISAGKDAVVFVDVGHCDTQVTVVRFEGQGFELLAEVFDRDLGGRDFDDVVFQHFKKMFESRYDVVISSSVKAIARLRAACEKAKLVLSSNKDADVNIEYLMEGAEDASGVITREEFEKSSKDLLDRIVGTCREAVERAELAMGGVSSVELVGSGSRVPAISRRLVEFFDRELSRTLNGSECVARGCALRCEELLRIRDANNLENELEEQGIEGSKRKQLGNEISREEELLKQDEAVKLAKDKRNDLEALIYNIQKKLKMKGVEGEDLNKLIGRLSDIENWLNGEGSDTSLEDYENKFNEVVTESTRFLSKEEILNQIRTISYDPSVEETSIGSRKEQSRCSNWILRPWYFLRAALGKAKDACVGLVLCWRNHDQTDDYEAQKSRDERSRRPNWSLCPWYILRVAFGIACFTIAFSKAKDVIVGLACCWCNHDESDDEECQKNLLQDSRPTSPGPSCSS